MQDRETVENIIKANAPLVQEVARHFPRQKDDPDLLQCGMIGLWEAAEHWDGIRPFKPLARTCIMHNMMDYVRKCARWGPTAEDREQIADEDPEILSELDLKAKIAKTFKENSRERLVLTALSSGVSRLAIADYLGVKPAAITKIALDAYRKMKEPPQ